MSAIAGIFYFHGRPASPDSITQLTDAMRSRGPDSQTDWTRGSISLGHCMLRTTPESLEEQQPLMSHDGNLVLVWDGRLDNREELRRNLGTQGVTIRDNTDPELVLQSYTTWGKDCPKKLLGDFAFAIWDEKAQHLFCARDPMGGKGLSYFQNETFFAFASSERGLVSLNGVPMQPNEKYVAYCLSPDRFNFDDYEGWLKGIWGLPNGQSLTVDMKGNTSTNTYWEPDSLPQHQFTSDDSCTEAFLEIFSAAVKCRLRSIGTPAMMTSGGLDSASILSMARRLLPGSNRETIRTYSVIEDKIESCIESQCIKDLIKAEEITATTVGIPSLFEREIGKDLLDVAWGNAHPVDNSILIPTLMCKLAGDQGDRVLLNGACGDITLSAVHRYIAEYLSRGDWHQAWEECKLLGKNQGRNPLLLWLINLYTGIVPEKVKSPIRNAYHLSRSKVNINDSFINPLFASKMLRVLSQEENVNPNQSGLVNKVSGIVSAQSACNRISQRFGVETWDPWADRRVVEFCHSLPFEYKIREGRRKHIVREAFRTDLSPLVRNRTSKEHLGGKLKILLMAESLPTLDQNLDDLFDLTTDYIDKDKTYGAFIDFRDRRQLKSLDRLYDFFTLAFWLKGFK